MIKIFITDSEHDHHQENGRVEWGTLENGVVVEDRTDELDNELQDFNAYTWDNLKSLLDNSQEHMFESFCDPFAVLNEYNNLEYRAGVPSKTSDTIYWDGDYQSIIEDGDLSVKEEEEVSKYEENSGGHYLEAFEEFEKKYDYEDRYSRVIISTGSKYERADNHTVHGIWDTKTQSIIEDSSGMFEEVLDQMRALAYPLDNSIGLFRCSKHTRTIIILDTETGEPIEDIRDVFQSGNCH